MLSVPQCLFLTVRLADRSPNPPILTAPATLRDESCSEFQGCFLCRADRPATKLRVGERLALLFY